MSYYHSGFIPLENNANIFAFRIDLTAPELIQNKYRDNGLGTGLETAMMNLNDVTNAIAQTITSTREKLITQQQETTLNATMRRGGKGKKQKGGIYELKPAITDPAFTPSEAFSAQKLKNECMNDLEKDIFNSRNRIFVVDGKLPMYTPPALDALQAQEKQLEEELARNANMPAPAAGGRRKRRTTHKKKQPGKKGKSRRMRR
jgi:hypothetical protein